MADSGRDKEDMLWDMRCIRATNNDLWMGIVHIALKANPKETKKLINQIQKHDSSIADIWKEISNAPEDSD